MLLWVHKLSALIQIPTDFKFDCLICSRRDSLFRVVVNGWSWQPFYTPLLWPIAHVGTTITKADKDVPQKPTASPTLDFTGHLTSFAGSLRSFLIALFLVSSGEYPAFGAATNFSSSWMLPIIFRNLVATWVICCFWDWWLYFGPFKAKLHKYKINPVYPSFEQIKHDALFTTIASICGAFVEIVLCHLWATGVIPMDRSIYDRPLFTAIAALTITHWRIPHFWFIHRTMHPWKVDGLPDVGKFLYRHVHALHHKSYNPTSFSGRPRSRRQSPPATSATGTNMHPVEATLYYTAAFVSVWLGVHPAVAIGCIVDCAMGAWLGRWLAHALAGVTTQTGHDGFQWPGSGDYFHQLHHAHFDCNYGATHVPMDWWLGTFAGCPGDIKKIWGKKAAGEGANEGQVHPASSAGAKKVA